MQDTYLEDEVVTEAQPALARRYYILMSVVAVVAVIGSIAYGGYRILQDARDTGRATNYAPDYLLVGQELAKAGEYEAAIELFEGLVEESPSWRNRQRTVAIKSWLACCYNAQQDYEQAEKLLREVYSDRPGNLLQQQNNRFFLACALASQGKDDQAIDFLAEYLLMGGVYPRPDNTFKVAHQLQRLEESGRIQELRDLPQMGFEFLYGRRLAVNGRNSYEAGGTVAVVDLKMKSFSLTFHASQSEHQEFESWQMICYLDAANDIWRARLITNSSAIGEFSGKLEDGRLHMTGTWIPATGGMPVPARLQFTRDDGNTNLTRVRLVRSRDGSNDWSRAERICNINILRN